jgi:hypothetical protein
MTGASEGADWSLRCNPLLTGDDASRLMGDSAKHLVGALQMSVPGIDMQIRTSQMSQPGAGRK